MLFLWCLQHIHCKGKQRVIYHFIGHQTLSWCNHKLVRLMQTGTRYQNIRPQKQLAPTSTQSTAIFQSMFRIMKDQTIYEVSDNYLYYKRSESAVPLLCSEHAFTLVLTMASIQWHSVIRSSSNTKLGRKTSSIINNQTLYSAYGICLYGSSWTLQFAKYK